MLTLSPAACSAIVEHAEEGAPEEVCGVLAGRRNDDEGVAHVGAVRRVPNVASHPLTEYHLDPEAHLAAIEELEADDRAVVGFYHSHPAGPSHPSPTDEARATWPGYVYVIVSLDGTADVGAWTWTGERFEEKPLRVTD